MKETDKRRTPNSNQSKRSAKSERRTGKPNGPHQTSNGKEIESKALHAKPNPSVLVSDTNTGSEPSEVYEKNVVIHYVDDVNKFEGAPHKSKANAMIAKVNKVESLGDHSSDLENGSKQGKEEESDSETIKDSVSSQGDSVTLEDVKIEKSSKVSTSVSNKSFSESYPHGTRLSEHGTSKSQLKAVPSTPKKPVKSNKGSSRVTNKGSFDCNAKDMKIPPKPSSESSEGLDDKAVEDLKDVDAMDEASNGTQSVASDNETVDAEEIGEHEDEDALSQRIEEMEMRIEKLEEELREVAALEISLYSVVPEHGSSAHKVHTSARRLSRLYIHGCKHWTQDRRATIAKNTVSGLVLIAKSCGNDVPRLTFWLSNTIVLREIISQAFGTSCHSSSLARLAESNRGSKGSEIKATLLKWKGGISGGKQVNGRMHFDEDWQETGTLAAALEKVESWIFSRIVESVWWQALTPHMQSPNGNLSNKTIGRLLGPALGDQQQGSFSINLWKTAFQDALQRLCPVRGGGHVCGCLPIIARMVMEQCVARLDVAMFNAILRESAHEIPTDPVSDPILDSKVLPIPAGDLSFGSGAQLKNSVGNWSRWLTDMFGMDVDDSAKEVTQNSDDDDHDRQDDELKSFPLLNDLSDLLMLPKDMLIDRSIRMEVCPLISLPLVKRILCNFTPDEFCPDSVPGAVLEALNAESIVERRLSGETARNFPYTAAPVVYTPPCSADVAEKVAEAEARSHFSRNVSVVQRKGYTSDEELEELDSPLASVIEKLPQSPTILSNGTGKYKEHTVHRAMTNARYKLLHEVWSA